MQVLRYLIFHIHYTSIITFFSNNTIYFTHHTRKKTESILQVIYFPNFVFSEIAIMSYKVHDISL